MTCDIYSRQSWQIVHLIWWNICNIWESNTIQNLKFKETLKYLIKKIIIYLFRHWQITKANSKPSLETRHFEHLTIPISVSSFQSLEIETDLMFAGQRITWFYKISCLYRYPHHPLSSEHLPISTPHWSITAPPPNFLAALFYQHQSIVV